MNHGALAYSIDAHSGAVKALAAGASLAYFNPGCGAGGQIVLTTYPGSTQGRTVVHVLDAVTGTLQRPRTGGTRRLEGLRQGQRPRRWLTTDYAYV